MADGWGNSTGDEEASEDLDEDGHEDSPIVSRFEVVTEIHGDLDL